MAGKNGFYLIIDTETTGLHPHCSFCGLEQTPTTPLIAGSEGWICEACVKLADQVVTNWGRKRILSELHGPIPKPAKIKAILDNYVIGQELAKEILAAFGQDDVSQFAHVIGGLCGSLFGFLVTRPGARRGA